MSTEHNPIAVLVSQIQQKWNQEVQPFKEIKMTRWMIKPEEARLFEGFLKLESTPHGSVPSVVVVLLTPFSTPETFSKDLATHWLQQYKEDKAKAEKENVNSSLFDWDFSVFEKQLDKEDADFNILFKQMLSSFLQSFTDKQTNLVIGLMPKTVSSVEGYKVWLHEQLKTGIPKQVSFMIFDYIEERYFDELFRKHEGMVKSLFINLDLQGAIGKLSKMGDPNSPEVQFRTCMQEMGQAVTANSISRLQTWGNKGLEVAQKTGIKSFFASAHIIYAGMLFNFKKFDEINVLLDTALRLAGEALRGGDKAAPSLIIQCYAYKAACCQHQGEDLEAAALFEKQAEMAMEQGFGAQALTPLWQAYNLYQKKDTQKYTALLEKTYSFGSGLTREELETSCIGNIAFDYYGYMYNLRQADKCQEINDFMISLQGEDWKDAAEKFKIDTKPKKRFLFM